MEEALNSTVHPACIQEPPLALDAIKQLDLFGVCQYCVLTFMSCVSLLLYLELCLYIYKKMPYPKKTKVIWINGAAPVISIMACFGMWIPRAIMFTDMTSSCYFAVVVYKVLLLLIEEFGGCNAFLKRFAGEPFMISTGPCCCCCPCIPRVPMSRRMLFMLRAASLQYAILKTTFSVFSIILWTNGIYDPFNLNIAGVAIWIGLFVGVLTIISLWPVAIIFMNTNKHLRSVKIIPKYAMYQLVLVLSQLQTSIINILALNGVIACSPPFSSQARGSKLSQQLMIMEMFIITLVNRLLYHRPYDAVLPEERDNPQNNHNHNHNHNSGVVVQAAVVEHDV